MQKGHRQELGHTVSSLRARQAGGRDLATPDAKSVPHAKEGNIIRWPYYAGLGLILVFISEAWPWTTVSPLVHLASIVISLVVVLILPGTFLVGLVFSKDFGLSLLSYLGLSFVGSLVVTLAVGYALSSYRLLDQKLIFLSIGGVSLALIGVTWIVRGQTFHLCTVPLGTVRDILARRQWTRMTIVFLACATFIASLIISSQSNSIRYPSVYLTNLRDQLGGYPNQEFKGQSKHLELHIDNRGGKSRVFVIAEYDNGQRIWLHSQRIHGGQSWSQRVRLPASQLGNNLIQIVVRPYSGETYHLHIAYRVRT